MFMSMAAAGRSTVLAGNPESLTQLRGPGFEVREASSQATGQGNYVPRDGNALGLTAPE